MTYTFNKCCFCIDLRCGCLIIGFIGLVCEIIGITVFMIALLMLSGKWPLTPLDTPGDEEDTNITSVTLMAVLCIIFLTLVFLFGFTIALLVGLYQNKRGLVRAYLVYSYVFMVLCTVLLVILYLGSHDFSYIAYKLLYYLLFIYSTQVIRSYYHKMDSKRLQTDDAAA